MQMRHQYRAHTVRVQVRLLLYTQSFAAGVQGIGLHATMSTVYRA